MQRIWVAGLPPESATTLRSEADLCPSCREAVLTLTMARLATARGRTASPDDCVALERETRRQVLACCGEAL